MAAPPLLNQEPEEVIPFSKLIIVVLSTFRVYISSFP
jgi:hypothetical protein